MDGKRSGLDSDVVGFLYLHQYVGLRSWRKALDVGNFEVCLLSRWSRL
jgi:hypothetical protein